MNKFFTLFIIVFTSIFATSCLQSRPSQADCEDIFKAYVSSTLTEQNIQLLQCGITKFLPPYKGDKNQTIYPFQISVTISDGTSPLDRIFECEIAMNNIDEWVLLPGPDGTQSPVYQMNDLITELRSLH